MRGEYPPKIATGTITRGLAVSLAPVGDFAALGERWRALEARADASFFQSWTWTGCLAAERFPDPVLLAAEAEGETVALALFNRRGGWRGETLFLGESGAAGLDSPFIEHNGPLIARGWEDRVMPALLGGALRGAIAGGRTAAGRWAWGRGLVLSGVPPALEMALRAAGAVTRRVAERVSPFLTLPGPPLLDRVSANTRYQIRRAERRYAAAGPLEVTRAGAVAQAWEWLEAMAALHQAGWQARGKPGAFAEPFFGRFHRELIARALPQGACDLLRITAGGRIVGFLYNLIREGRVLSYQSGFDYAGAGGHEKPGLVCHHLAVERYRQAGYQVYDLLAGESRYKSSLADSAATLLWLEAAALRSVRGRVMAARGWVSGGGARGHRKEIIQTFGASSFPPLTSS